MPRSAIQRAARRALRASRPVFPLTTLPPELQLNVLCKCDPVSFHIVLQVSKHLRVLFLRYPETCLQQVFGQLPAPLLSLLHTSWALHNNKGAGPDVGLLFAKGKIRIDHYYLSPCVGGSSPFLVADGLVDLYQEVHVATNLYAQSLNAAMEAFVNPWTEVKPITLSSAEYLRIASTLSMLRVFYQLQLKCSAQEDIIPICRTYLAHLDRWQVEQLAAVDEFLSNSGYGRPSAIYNILDAKYSDWTALSNGSTYAERYFQTLKLSAMQGAPSAITPASILKAARPIVFRSLSQPQPPPPPSQWNGLVDEAFTQMMEEKAASIDPSRTFGLILYEYMIETQTMQWQWRPCFIDLGMFFWDYDRLVSWGIPHQPDFPRIFTEFNNKLQRASRHGYRPPLRLHPSSHYSEEQKAEIITRWTRAPIPCSLEEWLWQHYALDRYSQSPPANVSFDPIIQGNVGVERSCFDPQGCRFHDPY